MTQETGSVRDATQAALEEAQQTVHAVFDTLGAADWQATVFSEGETWTVRDVLYHLLDAERGMGWQVTRIRDGSGSGVPDDFDIDRWNRRVRRQSRDSQADGPALLAELDAAHAATLALVDSLQADDWRKVGRQAVAGEITVEQWFRVIAGHKMQHAAEVRAALAAPA